MFVVSFFVWSFIIKKSQIDLVNCVIYVNYFTITNCRLINLHIESNDSIGWLIYYIRGKKNACQIMMPERKIVALWVR